MLVSNVLGVLKGLLAKLVGELVEKPEEEVLKELIRKLLGEMDVDPVDDVVKKMLVTIRVGEAWTLHALYPWSAQEYGSLGRILVYASTLEFVMSRLGYCLYQARFAGIEEAHGAHWRYTCCTRE